ncbi:MAG: methylated-DNA--[protein]-cysteine S-methyltransferase [Clostridiales Family XIII bacterium]|jgi:methylated-DNA-[protein]-cysteine S-methyltransferase|nr:methylated-DNA--[protein]-cysteine S-methyltransferase [Clostridiales Family XIII bacterium]
MQYIHEYHSPLGVITLASDGDSLIGLWFHGQKYFAETLQCFKQGNTSLPIFHSAQAWLDCYFRGENPGFMPPISLKGSKFRMDVWKILSEIPYGEVITYGDIARQLVAQNNLSKMSAQAVGGAVGHNPISIIVPCHRVVGTNSSLTGYAGGIEKKIKLLNLEGVDTSKLTIPTKGTAL